MFRAVFLPIIRSFSAVQRHWYSLCSSVTDCYQDQDGTGRCVLILVQFMHSVYALHISSNHHFGFEAAA
jgi:hypothetical protein